MKKVLIISYFFPPCNLTASQRIGSWAKYLNRYGYKPIVVTRKWERPVHSFIDCHYPTSNGVQIEKNNEYEVYYCPYSANLRDRLNTNNKLATLRKLLSFAEILLQNVNLRFCVFNNLYFQANQIINSSKDIEAIVISGNPFIQFKFGYMLHKLHNLPWIADYRDAWTTSTIDNLGSNTFFKLLNRYHQYFENKWVSTASHITASSEPIAESVTKLTGVMGGPVYNGFEPDDFDAILSTAKSASVFQIAYIGTLYDGQDIGIFLEGYKLFVDKKKPNAKLLFPGLKLLPGKFNKVCKLMEGYERYFEATDRIPREEILVLEKKSHILLHVAWKGHEGIIASKIYEYIGSGTKILVVPGDMGAIDSIIAESNCGVIANTYEETYDFLCAEFDVFIEGGHKNNNTSSRNILQYSREEQTKVLGQVINNILK